jgi:hypothetical protein
VSFLRVRATARFFQDLDRQLPSERGRHGEPSTTDFQTFELLRIVETFSEQFFTLPELIPGRVDYRVLIATGTVVPAFSVLGQLASDGVIELIQLDIDRARPEEEWSDDDR